MVNKIARMLIKYKAIEFGDFTLTSGAKSPYYIDVKSAATNPEFLVSIASEIAKTEDFDMVAGVAIGGVPLAVATGLVCKKPYAIIRASEKGHGKNNVVIGDVRGRVVLLVEDVTTSGGSALYGVEVLRGAGARCDHVVTVVDREVGAEKNLSKHGIHLLALVRIGELLKNHKKFLG